MTKARLGIAAQLRDLSYAWAEFLRALSATFPDSYLASMLDKTAMRIDARNWAQEDDEYWLRGSDDERRP